MPVFSLKCMAIDGLNVKLAMQLEHEHWYCSFSSQSSGMRSSRGFIGGKNL
jgi:hypothetical protein